MAATCRTRPNSARPTQGDRVRPATVPRRLSRAPWSRTCESWLQRPRVPVALAMPVVDPKHPHAQAERHRTVVDLRADTRLITAVGGDQRFIQNRQAAHFGETLDRGIDGAQRFLLAAVVIAQDV